MNVIYQEREDILRENNTAQTEFENILKNLDLSITIELNIYTSLFGDLDLSILENEQYKFIRSLIFNEGSITSIKNIPNGISKLVISGNLLTELENLPKSLNYLDFSKNYIKEFDFTYIPDLEELHCKNNKLEKLIYNDKNKLQVLNIENNVVKFLDLKDFKKLLELNINNNPYIILDNFDVSNLKNFINDNNHIVTGNMSSISKDDENIEEEHEKQLDYITALNKYFKLKEKYFDNIRSKKMKTYKKLSKDGYTKKAIINELKKFQPKCFNCNKIGGTIFSIEENCYIAICGSKTEPCKLNIKLYKGEYESIEALVNVMESFVIEHKEDIIKLKLDTLLNFISEESAASSYKKKIEAYTEDNNIYLNKLKIYNEIFNDETRNNAISKKNIKVNTIVKDIKMLLEEYKKDNNIEILKNAVNVYTKDLIPEVENLSKLKYDQMEVIKDGDKERLCQYVVKEERKKILIGDPPKIEKFIMD